jgi:hypothetical protein
MVAEEWDDVIGALRRASYERRRAGEEMEASEAAGGLREVADNGPGEERHLKMPKQTTQGDLGRIYSGVK